MLRGQYRIILITPREVCKSQTIMNVKFIRHTQVYIETLHSWQLDFLMNHSLQSQYYYRNYNFL
jgi:hypothetical protein